jgi:hypothetical protein
MTIVSILFALLLSGSGNFLTNTASSITASQSAPLGGGVTVDEVSGGGPTG